MTCQGPVFSMGGGGGMGGGEGRIFGKSNGFQGERGGGAGGGQSYLIEHKEELYKIYC